MITITLFLMACNAITSTETTPEPAPVTPEPERPISAEVTAEQQAADWVKQKYPGIPDTGFTVECEPEGCTVEIPEHKQLHHLTCTTGGCAEAGEASDAPDAGEPTE